MQTENCLSKQRNLFWDLRSVYTKRFLPVSVITVRNEVAKVMFLHLSVSHSVHRGGVLSQNALQVVSQHALQWGVLSQNALQVVSQHALQRGCLLPGGVQTPPESRRLLLRTVRILLECILVTLVVIKKTDRMGSLPILSIITSSPLAQCSTITVVITDTG